jgi:hypothetical protein
MFHLEKSWTNFDEICMNIITRLLSFVYVKQQHGGMKSIALGLMRITNEPLELGI